MSIPLFYAFFSFQVHRRTLYDDSRGVGEPINETGLDGEGLIIRGKHFVILDSLKNATEQHRLLGESLFLRPHHIFIRDKGSYKDWTSNCLTSVSSLVIITLKVTVRIINQKYTENILCSF